MIVIGLFILVTSMVSVQTNLPRNLENSSVTPTHIFLLQSSRSSNKQLRYNVVRQAGVFTKLKTKRVERLEKGAPIINFEGLPPVIVSYIFHQARVKFITIYKQILISANYQPSGTISSRRKVVIIIAIYQDL